jgi:Cu(I)/Ag(I) efflux system membrane fusion protein/cobalt-zinc-cadmium efflux system membrane fusion protein
MTSNPTSTAAGWRRWLGYAAAAIFFVALGAAVAAALFISGTFRPDSGGSSGGTETAEAAAPQLWTCGMHPQVIQDRPGKCPICHMELTPLKTGASASAAPGGERKVKYWWDPMIGPSSISDRPGKSAMGMDLVPVYEDDEPAADAGAVVIDPVVVQNM